MPYANKQNLIDFWSNAKKYIAARDADGCDWESVPVNTSMFQFEAAPRTPVNPVIEFGFTETPPASGEKSPSNPSTITGVESVKVGRCGKNLLIYPYIETSHTYISGLTATTDADGLVTVNGTSPSTTAYFSVSDGGSKAEENPSSMALSVGEKYTVSLRLVSGSVASNTDIYLLIIDHEAGTISAQVSIGNSVTFTATSSSLRARLEIKKDTSFSNVTIAPQLELGSNATAFEPYSGTEAAIGFGSTQYGGTLDVATGKMMVTHVAATPEASTVDISSAPAALPLDYADTFGRTITSSNGASLSVGSAGGTVVYKLATPRTVQLDPVQLTSVLSSSRINTVYTDTGTISQLTYAKPMPTEEDVFRYANWHRTETAGAVACCPVPESELHPVVNFSFTETPPEEGDKSPSNPSTISGVSSVSAGRAGKNLLVQTTGLSDWGGMTVTANPDGSYTFNGSYTTTGFNARAFTDSGATFGSQKSSIILDPNKNYTLTCELISGTVALSDSNGSKPTFTYGHTDSGTGKNSLLLPLSIGKTSTTSSNGASGGKFIARIDMYQPATFTNAVYRFQLEEGDTATDFEVPMRSADLRFINLNGTYYGGSIDLSTGLMTVTYTCIELDGSYQFSDSSGDYNSTTGLRFFQGYGPNIFHASLVNGSATCSHFRNNAFSNADVVGGTVTYPCIALTGTAGSQLRIAAPFSSASGFNEWLAEQKASGTPVLVTARLATPYTVQLTPTQIKALPALDKYSYRVNTLYTDADSIQVGYMKSPIKTEEEFNNAILALGGNL